MKRKRGNFSRPRKVDKAMICYNLNSGEKNSILEQNENEVDLAYHALLAKIQGDPQTFREAINSADSLNWQDAINAELNSLKEKEIFEVVKKKDIMNKGERVNVLDSRWVFKRKIDETGNVKFKARLVIRGFKDKNVYELREVYAPVSRLPLVRAFLAIANKLGLHLRQLDVEISFLYGDLDRDIYMEIPEGVGINPEIKRERFWKLKKSLYGLKTSSKKWNEKFKSEIEKLGFKPNDTEPCLFTRKIGNKFIVILLYVDDILFMGDGIDLLRNVVVVGIN